MESGKDKIQKICDEITKETLEPAQQQAKEIIENANLKAGVIIKDAEKQKQRLMENTQKELEKEKKVFDAALNLAARQSFDVLKQKIEKELFNKTLLQEVSKSSCDVQIISKTILEIIESIKKSGLEEDISAFVPKKSNLKQINEFLATKVLDRLKEKEILISDIKGGAKIQLHKSQITLDLSDDSLYHLLLEHLREDFRDKLFV